MKNQYTKSFVIIGTGNLATHLSLALVNAGYRAVQVAGRTERSARALARKLKCSFTLDLDLVNTNAELYFVCVNDDSIKSIFSALDLEGKMVMHTSGTCPLIRLENCNTGVLYPLYTFSKNDSLVDFSVVPVFIEASGERSLKSLRKIAKDLGTKSHLMNSSRREKLHLSAVLTANFSNYLFTLASEYLKQENAADFNVLLPLLKKTISRLEKQAPADAQTGPARRGDKKVTARHRDLLRKYKETLAVYDLLSSNLERRYRKAK